ncbi:MAG TPA: DUF6132 family protein [Candidatus Hydrogenedentes bacterium]|nr:DUF6132 family protein [Candidatus Hydrogenedentota bacterium]
MLVPILRIGAAVAIGAGLGAVLGSTRSCETGGCPLTANPRRGALYGGLMGLLIAFSFATPSGPVIEADSGIVEVTSAQQFNERVSQSSKPVVAYFHAPWCGVCREVGPTINEMSRDHGQEAVFLGLNTDENPDLAQEFAVQYLPTTIVFRGGREEARFVGAFDSSHLLELLQPEQTASRSTLTSPH